MFNKLKDKLKNWTDKISEVEEETIEETTEEIKRNSTEEKGFLKKIFSKKENSQEQEMDSKEEIKKNLTKPKKEKKTNALKKEKKRVIKEKSNITKEEKISSPPELKKEIIQENQKEKKSFLTKLISNKKIITEKEFDEYSEDLEMILLENNVALEVTEKIIDELKEKIINQELDKKQIIELITKSLKEIIQEVLLPPFDIIKEIKNKKEPYTMIFCGINGVGKTTQIAKMANMLKEQGISSVMAAGDTFRAAAIEQLKKHGENLDIKVISHEYGSDPASVGFDAIKYAEKNKIKVVLIDTAGRIHTATNLLREMEKIKKVCKPDRTIFVGESITGNDAVDQVKAFDETIGIDGIFLSKADIDEKGGTALSVGYITKKPILFLGTGQNYKDLEIFDKEKFIKKLEL